jgi:hypothetical protein
MSSVTFLDDVLGDGPDLPAALTHGVPRLKPACLISALSGL